MIYRHSAYNKVLQDAYEGYKILRSRKLEQKTIQPTTFTFEGRTYKIKCLVDESSKVVRWWSDDAI